VATEGARYHTTRRDVNPGFVPLSPALAHFRRETGARHAFQMVVEMDRGAADPFTRGEESVARRECSPGANVR